MEYGNAARFLKSYNNIESRLKILYSARPTQNFTDLVKRCTDLNITVRRYENELVDYGKLRNAIVHRTAGGELFIANPCDEVVDTIESIEKQICDPPRITDALKVKKLASVFADKPLLEAAETFAREKQKTLLVYDHGNQRDLHSFPTRRSADLVRRTAGENVTGFLRNTLCGNILDEKVLQKYLVMSREATVFDVFEAFETHKGIYAVIVTENGILGEKALLLITPSDFPLINRFLETYCAKSF